MGSVVVVRIGAPTITGLGGGRLAPEARFAWPMARSLSYFRPVRRTSCVESRAAEDLSPEEVSEKCELRVRIDNVHRHTSACGAAEERHQRAHACDVDEVKVGNIKTYVLTPPERNCLQRV